jgi:Tfp pilus tip-associated adhesin PilY1
VIYAGANDGYLHGFHDGAWDTSLTPDGHNRGTGEELMGFMPYGVRTSVKDYVKFTSGLRTQVLVDGSPVVADVWFNRDTVGTPPTSLSSTVNPTLTTKHALQWRTVLIQSLRDGGQHYSALDITNPPASASTATTTYPRYLWAFPAESTSPTNGATSTESTYVGNTWSEPVITRVRVKPNSTTDTNSYERWVAVFGGGYHTAGDPNGTGYKVPGDTGFTAKGRAIYMVDLTTGKVLAKKNFDNAALALNLATSEQVGIKEMRYAIPSAPAVFDIDFDGFADVIYIGDLGGNLWKWVVDPPGQDPIHNTTVNNNAAQPDWPFRLFVRGSAGPDAADEPPPEHSGAAWDSSVHYQSFFYPPTGALRQGTLILAFGAGERADPIGPASEWGDGVSGNNNHYYVVKDADPREVVGTLPNRLTGTIVEDCSGTCVGEGELADFDAPTPPTCAQMKASYVGYYITARDAEKFVTASTIFLGEVFTGSFFPADPSTTTICDSRGTSYLYRFDLECGVGGFPDNADAQEDRREPVGAGLPTRPRVSVGDLNQGDPSGCVNKIVVVTSDGEIWNDCPGSIPSSGVKVRSWRER